MRVDFPAGKYENFHDASEAIEFLSSLTIQNRLIEPEKIFIRNDGKALYLIIFEGTTFEYSIRQSFLEKLMK
jgi:hypothetical protein